VEDRADLVLVEHAEYRVVVGEVGLDQVAAVLDALQAEAAVVRKVAPRHDHAGAQLEQALGQPAADETLRAGDQHRLPGVTLAVHARHRATDTVALDA
jgi:hypothetical protein